MYRRGVPTRARRSDPTAPCSPGLAWELPYRSGRCAAPRRALGAAPGQCLHDCVELEGLREEGAAGRGQELLQVGADDVAGEEDDALGEVGAVGAPALEDLL